jgi:glyoxylase-like metal-dependent hydrolase (beta-lactamase superfamily II)
MTARGPTQRSTSTIVRTGRCGHGERIGGRWTIEAVATPGHTSNHLCFALVEERALFTG